MIRAMTSDGKNLESWLSSIAIKRQRQIKADHVAVANVQSPLSHIAGKAERKNRRASNWHLKTIVVLRLSWCPLFNDQSESSHRSMAESLDAGGIRNPTWEPLSVLILMPFKPELNRAL
jgi:hypothetical protein